MRYTLMASIIVTAMHGPAMAEQLFTATCSPLKGAKTTMVNGKAKVTPEGHVGPIFFVDSDQPKILVSLWTLNLLGKETTDTYKATILEFSDEKIEAIEKDGNGIYVYTMFLKNGLLLYSHHRTRSIFDDNPSLLSFAARCEYKFGK